MPFNRTNMDDGGSSRMSHGRKDAPAPVMGSSDDQDPAYITQAEYAQLHGARRGTVGRWAASNRIPTRLGAGGERLVRRDAEPPRPCEQGFRGEGDASERWCGSCQRWVPKAGYSPGRWRSTGGSKCKTCAAQLEDFRRMIRKMPGLARAKELATLNDMEIVARRRMGQSAAPPESRIMELCAWAEREHLTGDGEDWRAA